MVEQKLNGFPAEQTIVEQKGIKGHVSQILLKCQYKKVKVIIIFQVQDG